MRAAFGVPPLMVFVAMIGFGSLAKSQDVDLSFAVLTAATIYGLPGQVAMLELHATGATLLAVVAGVAMANMRFFPMSVVLVPLFGRKGSWYRLRYLVVQVMSINSWSHTLDVLPTLPEPDRIPYFAGFGTLCFVGGCCGTALGWLLAASMPLSVILTLIYLNPAYFIFLFCCNTKPQIVISLVAGAILGPPLYLVSPDWGLPICGILAGTIGFAAVRLVKHD